MTGENSVGILRSDVIDQTELLAKFDIPFSPLPTYQEVTEDPQMIANDIFVDVDDPQYGNFKMVNSPLDYGDYQKAEPSPAPQLGEHSREVLADLGYTADKIDRLIEMGVAQDS